MDRSGMPPAVDRYVTVLVTLALAGVAAAATFQAAAGTPDLRTVLLGLLFVAGFLVLSRTSFTFTWQGHRHRMVLDEVAVYQGFLMLSGSLVVLLVAGASLLEQAMMRRRGLKAAFNVAQSTLGALLGWGIYVALTWIGSPPLLAALPAALLYPILSTYLVAGVFSRLTDQPQRAVFEERFLADSLVAGSVGTGAGVALAVLWKVHPITLLTLAPFAYLTHRYGVLSALADRELEVRKRLAEVTHELVGTVDEARAAERILDTLAGVLPGCGRVELVLGGGAGGVRVTRDFEDGPASGAAAVEVPVPGRAGTLGTLRVLPRRGGNIGPMEQPLVRIVAAQAGAAVEATRALAERERAFARLDTYLRSAADAVLLVHDGNVRYANPAAEVLFGLGDGRAARVDDLFEDPAAVLPGEEIVLAEARARDASGQREMVVEVHATPLEASAREEGVLMVVRDVTERKRLEEETERQREALSHQEKLSALGTLVAGVAHEINNPLTYMRGALELAKLDLEGVAASANGADAIRDAVTQATRTLDRVEDGVTRVERITHSLKIVAKPGNGERAPEDLTAIAGDVAQVVQVGLPRGIRLVTDLAPDLPPVVANASELHQVLLNLVKNAAEALADEGGTVRLATRAEGDAVIATVEDDGPGIPEDVQRRLFEPFFTTKRTGTGLGLSLSHRIVEAHGGEILLASEEGRGATFTIRLPAQP